MKIEEGFERFRNIIIFQLLIFLIFICFFQFKYYNDRVEKYKKNLSLVAKDMSHKLEDAINVNISILMALDYNTDSDGNISREKFNKLSKYYLDNFPDILYIQHKNKETVTDMVYPLEGNEGTLGKSLKDRKDVEKYVKDAINEKEIIINDPYELKYLDYKTKGMVIRYPIFNENNFNGFFVSVIDLNKFIMNHIPENILNKYSIRLFDTNGMEFFAIGNNYDDYYHSEKIQIKNMQWTINISRNSSYKKYLIKKVITNTFMNLFLAIALLIIEIKIFNKNQNIEELKKLQKEIREKEADITYMAYYDLLTDLPNKHLVIKEFNEKFIDDNLKDKKIAIIFLDLDDFKKINDTLGHNYGDEFLIDVASRFKNLVNDNISISRTAGDEFLIILYDISDINQVIEFCEEIKNIFKTPFNIEGRVLYSSASMGISIYPDNGKELYYLIRAADTAMYKGKVMGKNRYIFFHSTMEEEIVRKSEIEKMLKEGLNEDELSIYYQPQLDLKLNKIIGLEALIRWKNKKYGWISPGEFIPIAEETDTIIELGDWILESVFYQVKEWVLRGYNFHKVAINISAKQLEEKDFIKKIKNLIEKTEVSPKNIQLEITERILMSNIDHCVKILNELKDLEFTIALDDFGTGYSSLSYLAMLPVNILKIDKSFVDIIPNNEEGKAVIRGIIKLAHAMNIKVVAEGVEREEQVSVLKTLNCNLVQGYYFSKPVTKDQIEKMISNN
ncbi:MAG: EAL domain-containing protein [Clostridiaceae bacterium]